MAVHGEKMTPLVRRQRIFDTALILLALFFFLLWIFDRPSDRYVYAIAVNGTPVVYVESSRAARALLNRIKQEKSQGNRSATFQQEITITQEPAERKPVTPVEMARTKLEELLSVAAEKYVIVVDGKDAVALDSEEDAMAALEMLKSKYGIATQVLLEVPQFKEHVTVQKKMVDLALWRAHPEEAVAALTGTESGPTYYTVQKGDNGATIARKAGIRFSELKRLNPDLKWNRLQIGSQIIVSKPKPLITVITKEQVTKVETTPAGKRQMKAIITYENGQPVRRDILSRILMPSQGHLPALTP